jgi:monoamine oxidase
VRRRAAIDAAFDAAEEAGRAGRDEPLSQYAAKAGSWEIMFRAIITWYSSHEADQVSTLDYARYRDTFEDWAIPGGYGNLLTCFAKKEPLVLDCPVRRISRLSGRFLLEGERGRIEAKRIILALPTNVLNAGSPVIEPDLPAEIREALQSVPMGKGMKAVFALGEDAGVFTEESTGIGSDASSRTGAYHARPSLAPLVDAFYGGTLAEELERAGAQAAEDFARQEIRAVYGSQADRSLRFHCITGWNNDPYSLGAYSASTPGKGALRLRLAESFDDGLFLAGEHCSITAFSTVHGAWESGLLAAERAAASLD